MGLCRDNVTNYLAQLGYSVVRIPRENIAPLDLVGRDRDRMRMGTLDQLLSDPSSDLPPVARDQAASQVSGQRSSSMTLGIGINVMGNVLGALAGTSVGLEAAYQNARRIQFEFTDVLFDSVEPLAVGRYLANAEIDVGNPVLDRYLMGRGQLFVLTETLRSNSIRVLAENSEGGSASLDVPVIEQVLGGQLDADTSMASSGVVTYRGEKSVTFGFKSFRVGIENGELALAAAAPNDVAMAAGLGAPEHSFGSTGLIELDEGGLVE